MADVTKIKNDDGTYDIVGGGSSVSPATANPLMDGTVSVGTSTKYAREDHRHPSDTSRVPTTREVNGHALSSDVNITASDIGVQSGAEVNQNAFSYIQVGLSTISADSKTDTLELEAGTNVTLTADTANDKVTIDFVETDPVFTASPAYGITSTDITDWDNKSDFSGSYNDLTNKPTIPANTSDLNNDSGFISSETDPVFTASAASGIQSSDITAWNGKQDALVSGTNIKTVNSTSLLGGGNIDTPYPATTSTTLTAANWSGTTYTASVSGVTASNTVIVSPDPSDLSDYVAAGVYCSAQASGTLTFSAATAPTTDLTVNIVII